MNAHSNKNCHTIENNSIAYNNYCKKKLEEKKSSKIPCALRSSGISKYILNNENMVKGNLLRVKFKQKRHLKNKAFFIGF